MIKLCKEDVQKFLDLAKRNIYLEGNILKVINYEGDSELQDYIELCKKKDKENRRKRLNITKRIQAQNDELTSLNEENSRILDELKTALSEMEDSKNLLEVKTVELERKRKENERINEELKIEMLKVEEAKAQAEKAREAAESDLDFIQKKSQFELITTIVKVALILIVSVGVMTTVMYIVAIYAQTELQIIGATWSNMLGILLTNAFSIIGTIMGVKYASESKNKESGYE